MRTHPNNEFYCRLLPESAVYGAVSLLGASSCRMSLPGHELGGLHCALTVALTSDGGKHKEMPEGYTTYHCARFTTLRAIKTCIWLRYWTLTDTTVLFCDAS